jgi:excisionase family DNA binding protein
VTDIILTVVYGTVKFIVTPSTTKGAHMEAKTVSVPEAGKWLGIGRNAAYEAARRGEIPTIKIGRLLRVPVVALERKLEVIERRAS